MPTSSREDFVNGLLTAGAGLVAKVKPRVSLGMLLDQAAHGVELVNDGALEADFAAPVALGGRHGDLLFVYIEADKQRILVRGSSPVYEARHRPVRCNPRYTHREASHLLKRTLGPS